MGTACRGRKAEKGPAEGEWHPTGRRPGNSRGKAEDGQDGLRLDVKARLGYKNAESRSEVTVEHFVGGAVVAAGRNGITTGHR
jgi:hypothetical protein